MEVNDTGAILLAAGRSSRFGREDKLMAPLQGKPLAQYAAEALSAVDFGCRIAVCSRPLPVDWAALGFEQVCIAGDSALSASIKAGIARLRAMNLKACLIALADMPFIPSAHFRALALHGAVPVLASGHACKKMVPARFTRETWDDLEALSGDSGARHLLDNAPVIEVPAQWLVDIDTVEDLAQFASLNSAF